MPLHVHVSGASGGSDVRIDTYIRDCGSNLYVGIRGGSRNFKVTGRPKKGHFFSLLFLMKFQTLI